MTSLGAARQVFAHYLPRLDLWAEAGAQALDARLVPDGFTAAQHIACAQGFVLRTLAPFDDGPDEATADGGTLQAIQARTREVQARLDACPASPQMPQTVVHEAGQARVTQGPDAFVLTFALPNFLFHATTAFAILRASGVPLGKADFDGIHAYAPGFSFGPDDGA